VNGANLRDIKVLFARGRPVQKGVMRGGDVFIGCF